MAFIHAITLLTLLTLTQAAQLRFYGASERGGISSWTRGPTLASNVRICPNSLPAPFTLVCLPMRGSATSAEFFINDRSVRRETVPPYTIAGDFNGIAAPWTRRGSFSVRCELSNGEVVASRIVFSCSGSSPSTRPPTTRPPSVATQPPSFGNNAGGVNRANCVRIPALSSTARNGWTVVNRALFFRPQDNSRSVTSAGTAVATYKFTAPVSGTYGFTLDMSTSGGVDHNDVWVDFPSGGFTLTRGGSRRPATGWTKAYHNRNGRSNQVFSVDFNPHTFATRNSLSAGTEYTVRVGGRSTKTGYFSIIMFPCSGGECDGTNPRNNYWRSTRDRCA